MFTAITVTPINGLVRRLGTAPTVRGVVSIGAHMLVCTPKREPTFIGVHMSTRDSQSRGNGKSPPFHMRINPELKEQLEAAAAKDGTSLGNWFKELARKELKRQGIEPKG